MKPYIHIQETEVPLYRGLLVVVLTNDIEKLRKLIPFSFDNNSEVYGHSIYGNRKGKSGFYLVLNFDSRHRGITPGTITHEAVHIANFIADSRGIKSDFDNDEPIAYLADWVTDQVYKLMKKHNFKVKY